MSQSSSDDDRPENYSGPLVTTKVPRVGKSFSSRNPLPIGAIGLVFILVLLYAAFNAAQLPLIGGGTQYNAIFPTSANLKQGDDVRIAGVKSGTVDTVAIDTKRGDVKVTFTVKDGWVGNKSTASIQLRTLLGAKYLEIDSTGDQSLNGGGTIENGSVPAYDVYPAFTDLTNTVNAIDTNQLTKAFQTLADAFSGTPSSVRPVVDGLSRLSTVISSRDAKLQILLKRASDVTGVLSARSADLQTLLGDGSLLLQELNARRDAIHSLLINTQVLAGQLSGLVADNQKTLTPLLDNVNSLLSLLRNQQDNLDRGVALLGPFYRLFNNVIGNGRWFDNYVQNLSGGGVAGLLTSGLNGGG